jgi:carbon storage regulator
MDGEGCANSLFNSEQGGFHMPQQDETLNCGERVIIGKDIAILVVRICGDKVKIGIEAPQDVSILRQELVKEA